MSAFEQTIALVDSLSPDEKAALFRHLRKLVPLHPMEERLKASAETVLDAIERSNPLSIRGIEGLIAEASFAMEVLPDLDGWKPLEPPADAAFDFLLSDGSKADHVRLQVKMQRRKDHVPLMANDVAKTTHKWPKDFYVVEVQRTRGGKRAGEGTRPYRFGEFDVLAVSLGASKGHWKDFIYVPANWLLPDPKDKKQIFKYQPVSPEHNGDWTTDFKEAVSWHRSGKVKTIQG